MLEIGRHEIAPCVQRIVYSVQPSGKAFSEMMLDRVQLLMFLYHGKAFRHYPLVNRSHKREGFKHTVFSLLLITLGVYLELNLNPDRIR